MRGEPPIVHPRADLVLLRIERKARKGGILLSKEAQDQVEAETHSRAVVEAVGPGFYQGATLIPLDLEVGDKVMTAGGGQPVWGDGGDGSLILVPDNTIVEAG